MNQPISQDERFLARAQAQGATKWSKPQLTATELREALSGGANAVDALTANGLATGFSS